MKLLGWMPPPGEEPSPSLAERERTLAESLAARCSSAPESATRGWLDPVLEWNRERGASPSRLAHAREALRGDGTAVVTGQQPALAGGPLYTLYKLLTAVELAAEIERRSGRPCQAVFWLVGDDSDFGEVSGTLWPRPDFAVQKIRDEHLPSAGMMIGRLPAAERQAPLFSDPALWPGEGNARFERLSAALRRGGDWSGAVAATLFELWPALPILFVDGAHPAVLAAQRAWLSAAAAWPLRELLTSGAAEVREAGHEPALDPSLGERAIYRVEGDRRAPVFGDADASGEAGGLLAPNVVLRPLVQDLLLPNVATVVGPSEARYRAQLGPLYRHARIARPFLLPRLRAVLVPPSRDGVRDGSLASDDWSALRDPDRWLAERSAAEVPPELAGMLRAWRGRSEREAGELAPRLAELDGSLPQLLDSARGKIDFQLQRLEDGVLAKARQRLFRREPELSRWREFVRPRDGEQERSLTLWTPFLFGGGRPPEPLREAARAHVAQDLGAGDAVAVFVLDASDREETA